jgi:hypothetical protein
MLIELLLHTDEATLREAAVETAPMQTPTAITASFRAGEALSAALSA